MWSSVKDYLIIIHIEEHFNLDILKCRYGIDDTEYAPYC